MTEARERAGGAPRVLVIDDSATVLRLTKEALGAAGFEVTTALNPMTTAIEMGRVRPDIVLLDVEMPALSGTDVLRALRRVGCHAHVKIVLFSSLDEGRLQALAEQHGASGWIHKRSPLDGPGLVEQVRRHVGRPSAGRRRAALVIDDSRSMRRIMSAILQTVGFEAYEAANGREALALLEVKRDVEVVLVDLNMPELDGLGFVRALRGDARNAEVKVMMVTSETDLSHVARTLEAGADEYVMKPFTRDAIVDKLQILGLESAG